MAQSAIRANVLGGSRTVAVYIGNDLYTVIPRHKEYLEAVSNDLFHLHIASYHLTEEDESRIIDSGEYPNNLDKLQDFLKIKLE